MGKTILRITTIPIALKVLLEGQMKFIKEHGFNVIMVSSDGKERLDLIKDENCSHEIVRMTRKITPLSDLISLIKLCLIIRKYKPDIVHTHTPKAGLLGMLAAWICGIKIRIHTVAGLPLMTEKGIKLRLLKVIEKITYHFATQVWPNSPSLLEYIREHHFTSKKKLSIILNGSSNGIDLERFNTQNLSGTILEELKKSISYSTEFTYFLYAGRIVRDKGIEEFVSVFAEMAKTDDKIRLLLVGTYESNLDPLLSNITFEIVNNPSIIHISWTNNIEYYMALSDFFIFPSHREGFANVLLQAGAMELPVICSNIIGNIDLIKENDTGFLFKCNDSNSLKNTILEALRNRELAAKYATNLKNKIYQKYNRADVQEAILMSYNKLLQQYSS